MKIYTILLFLHVSGDIGLFIGLAIQLLGLIALRRVQRVEQGRVITGLLTIANPMGVIGAALTIATGLYMALTVWGLRTAWIAVALASIILFIAPIIGLVIEPRLGAIMKMIREEPDGPLPTVLSMRLHDPALGTALQTMATLLLGIVFLMTNKPPLAVATLTIMIALVTGLASGLPLWRKGSGRMNPKGEGLL